MDKKTLMINRAERFFEQNRNAGLPTEFTLGNGTYQKFVPVTLYLFLKYDTAINFIKTDPYKAIEAFAYNKYFLDKNIEELLENTDEKMVVDIATKMVEEIYGPYNTAERKFTPVFEQQPDGALYIDVYLIVDTIPGTYIKNKEKNIEKVGVDEEFQNLVDEFVGYYHIPSHKIVMRCKDYPDLIPEFLQTNLPIAN